VNAAPWARGRRRPVAVLLAAAVALGGVGTAAGMALGAVGATSPGRPHVGHHHDDAGPALRFAR
jgi:hypothetical protein